MIGYATLGSNDLEKGAKFYDDFLGAFGGQRAFSMDRIIFWNDAKGGAMLSLCIPYDEKTATAGNGNMLALAAETTDEVDAMYKKALELGATDEGEPGPRTDNFYGAYFRDLDGNKICCFKFT